MQDKTTIQRAALADFGLYAFRCDDVDNLLHRATELVSDALEVPLVKVLEHFPQRGEMFMRSGVNWRPGVVGHEPLAITSGPRADMRSGLVSQLCHQISSWRIGSRFPTFCAVTGSKA